MRRLISAAGASAALLLAAACAQQSPEVQQQSKPGGPALSTSANPGAGEQGGAPAPQAPKGGTRIAAEQVDASSLPAQYPHQLWTLREGRTVVAYGQKGACDTMRMQVRSQSAEQVRLRILQKKAGPEQVCTMQLEQQTLTAGLDEPLGDRELILDHRQV